MNRIMRLLKNEFDVELISTVHAMGMIFILGFEYYICGVKSISFWVVIQLWILGYFIGWTQRIIYMGTKVNRKFTQKMNVVLWILLPQIWILGFASLFKWFDEYPKWTGPVFWFTMLVYFIILWWFLKCFYKEETLDLNNMLSRYQKGINEQVIAKEKEQEKDI